MSGGTANIAPNGGVYVGFKVKIIDDGTSGGSLNNNEYLIDAYSTELISIKEGNGTNEMSAADYNNLGDNITIEIVSPDSF